MAEDVFDIPQEDALASSKEAMKPLIEKAKEAISLTEIIANLEADIKAARASLHAINAKALPDMMAELGIDKIDVEGYPITVKDIISGSLPKEPDKREAAFEHLKSIEGEDLIKTMIHLSFSRGQHNEAHDVCEDLKGRGLEPQFEESVHAQTLAAFAREKIKNGDPIDTDVLGLYTARATKIGKQKKQ